MGLPVEGARRRLAQAFRRCGLATPELDARLLVAHALGLDHAGLAAQAQRRLAARRSRHHRRAGGAPPHPRAGRPDPGRQGILEPAACLDPETLVPRPETETVVEAALAAVAVDRDQRRREPLRVADLGTGSGALLLALVSELPAAFGVGTDVSIAALARARANAAALGLAGRVAFVACDWGAALAGGFDLMVSNPPYVARGEIAALAPEVRDFDPRRALDGGPDGLDGYRAIAADARRLLAPTGRLVVELGEGQLAAVSALLTAAGFGIVAPPRHDLAGVARALAMRPLP